MDSELNLKKALLELLESMQSSINYAYPYSTLSEDRAHAALQTIQGKVKAAKILVSNITIKPTVR